MVMLVVGVLLSGCGGDADRGSMKSYSEPTKVVERVEFYLNKLKEVMADDNYNGFREPVLSGAKPQIEQTLPYALKSQVDDAALQESAVAKSEELTKVFTEEVWDPATADPVELAKAREGVQKCLDITAEIKTMLGG